jgi:hypothetical protein
VLPSPLQETGETKKGAGVDPFEAGMSVATPVPSASKLSALPRIDGEMWISPSWAPSAADADGASARKIAETSRDTA